MKRRLTGSSAFTLVEVLVAVVLISIGLLSVTTAYQEALFRQNQSRYRQIARNLAISELEFRRAAEFDSLITGTATQSTTLMPGGSVSVETAPYIGDHDFYKVIATVSWAEDNTAPIGSRARGAGSVQMTTMVVNP